MNTQSSFYAKMAIFTAYDDLCHFGIKGQRWGIRRFQNEDRTLTEEGKKRYGIGLTRKVMPSKLTDDERAKVAKELNNRLKTAEFEHRQAENRLFRTSQTRFASKDANADYSKAYLNMRATDQKVKDLKILQKINQQRHISQHRLNLEQKYRDKGMTPEQAQVAAYKRDKTEKIIAIAGITTMAVAAAWLHKNHMADIDKVIPKDTVVQNLSADPNKGIHDAFYAAYDERDKQKYMRLFGGDHMQRGSNRPIGVQKLSVQAMSEMKIAGANTGREVANDLISTDRSYRDAIKGIFRNHGVGNDKKLGMLMEMNGMGGYRNLQDAVYDGKPLNKQGYNFLNRMLVDHSPEGQSASSKLFGALRKRGYDGTIDLNDVFNSGYDAKAPVVIFNGASKLGNIQRATIDPLTLKGGAKLEMAKVYAKQMANSIVPGIAAIKGAKKIGEVSRKRMAERKLINKYKREHPNTKMNDLEILNSIMNS